MSDEKIREFREKAVGFALMQIIADSVGGNWSILGLTGRNERDIAAHLGRAAISAVDATAEVERAA